MTVTADQTHVGFGRRLRKEDARFLRGEGHYVDDFVLPGMLHGAVLRSPYAHAQAGLDRHVSGGGTSQSPRSDHRRVARDAESRLDAVAVP